MFGLEVIIAAAAGSVVGGAINSDKGKEAQAFFADKAANVATRASLAAGTFFCKEEIVQAARAKAAQLRAEAKAKAEEADRIAKAAKKAAEEAAQQAKEQQQESK